jgi:4-amino-4-deoxy-L-arabinose transferase-like glycosyltransferase
VQFLRRHFPELILILAALFFTYRELGTFPRSWLDEGLFIMTARFVAAGHGYGIPLLDHVWYYPYFLAVGPTIILPAALSMKLFGASVAAARLPMTFYVLGSVIATYGFTARMANKNAARFAAALLITLSAFINTGKPVLGEIPAFFFLLLGFWAMDQLKGSTKKGLASGIFFGLALLTKLTYGLILPALAVGWIAALLKKKWGTAWMLTLSGVMTVVVYLPWRIAEAMHTPLGSLTSEIGESIFGSGDLPLFYVLRENRELLMRLPLLAFGCILILGLLGLTSKQIRLSWFTRLTLGTTAVLFVLYFLNSYGWYRHLLTAHLLLIPFVPAGMFRIAERKIAMFLLIAIIVAQGVWQFQHLGSGLSTALAETVEIVQRDYTAKNLIIEEAEVFAQLPENPHWLFLIHDNVSPTMPPEFRELDATLACWPRLRKLGPGEAQTLGKRVKEIGGYSLVEPPANCRK